jgi:hypothetical protein
MTVRFETTPNGELAILPRAEYERLKKLADEAVEDAGTARLVARAKKEIVSVSDANPYSAGCSVGLRAGFGAPTLRRRSESESAPPSTITIAPNQISSTNGL